MNSDLKEHMLGRQAPIVAPLLCPERAEKRSPERARTFVDENSASMNANHAQLDLCSTQLRSDNLASTSVEEVMDRS